MTLREDSLSTSTFLEGLPLVISLGESVYLWERFRQKRSKAQTFCVK